MQPYLILFITTILGVLIGSIITKLILSSKNKTVINNLKSYHLDKEYSLNQQLETEKIEKEKFRRLKDELSIKISKLETSYQHLLEKNKEQNIEYEKLQEKFKIEFENLATKILEEKSVKFTQQNKDNILNILNPLQEKIQYFETKIEQTHKESIDYHAALRQQIIGLKDMNIQMSKETLNLTKALKGDNKIQGNWGELVLENVLEKSGLEKNREYFVQQNLVSQDNKRQMPDVIINLPDGKKMIIDSKVTLVAYEKFVNETDENLRNDYLKQHVISIKKHIDQLSAKNYFELYKMESPDFVLLFIPIEPAFAVAIEQDNQLYNKAFEQRIIIVTPTTLLATLKTIDSMWINQKQQQNAIEIARQAGALYDKFEGFVNDLMKIGRKMDDAKIDYDHAMNKLIDGKGNIISGIQKLKIMGAKAKKSLPENLLNNDNLSN